MSVTRSSYELSIAVNNNSIDEVRKHLDKGSKLAARSLGTAFLFLGQASCINPEIVDLLASYNALPDDISVATIKFILFLSGNKQVQKNDFENIPDLNLNGHPFLDSPMSIVVTNGHEYWINFLITNGVKERPLHKLFSSMVDDTGFRLVNLLKLDDYRKNITDNLAGKNPFCIEGTSMEVQCRIAELLITNSSSIEIENIIARKEEFPLQLLPFFAWTAKNNRADLFDNEGFVKLFLACKDDAGESLKIAASFDSKEYISEGINFTDEDAVKYALSVACVSNNQAMLNLMIHTIESIGVTLNEFLKPDHYMHPLFWSIRCKNKPALAILLTKEFDVNDQEPGTLETYLHLAARIDLETVVMLVKHGARISNKNICNQTPLHTAVDHHNWDIGYYLTTQKADIYAQDFKGKTPLDKIEDVTIKQNFIDLSQGTLKFNTIKSINEEKAEPQSYLSYIFKFGFLTTLRNSLDKTPTKSPEHEKLLGVLSRV